MSGRQFWLALLTGLWLGRLRPAPGTIGSLPPVLMAMILAWLLGPEIPNDVYAWTINGFLIAMGLFFSIVCVCCGKTAEEHFGRKDPPDVVADEVAGQSIALLLLPWRSAPDHNALIWNLSIAATAYVMFRVMDIFKPPPLFALQRLPHGWGMLVDDLAAGIYAMAATQIIVRWLLPFVWTLSL